MTRFRIYLLISLVLSLAGLAAWGAARGSGTNTNRCIGSPCEYLYLPVSREEPGYFTDASSSVNRNMMIISSAVYGVNITPNNTNYIQLTNTLQSGATFYVASGTVNEQLNLFGRVNIATTTSRAVVSISTIAPTVPILSISTGTTQLLEVTGSSVTIRASSAVVTSLVSCNTVDTDANGVLSCGVDNTSGLPLPQGATNYIQVSNTLQSASTFYVSSGTVGGEFHVVGSSISLDSGYDLRWGSTGSVRMFSDSTASSATIQVGGINALTILAGGTLLAKFPGAVASIAANHGCPHDTECPLYFGTDIFDTNGYTVSASSDRFTVPVGLGGANLIFCSATWDETNSGDHTIQINKNCTGTGCTPLRADMVDGNADVNNADFWAAAFVVNASTDTAFYTCVARHSTGGVSKTLKPTSTQMGIFRLGP